jgi:hypothetical protein
MEYFNRLANFTCDGVDGNPYSAQLVHHPVYIADLSKPVNLGARYDWVLSLEVGEHIPAEYEETFMQNLDKHSKDGIVLSWAVRGQGGDGHVNCKDNEEVIPVVCSMGYDYEIVKTKELREECATYPNVGWWFRNTLMVFRRRKK